MELALIPDEFQSLVRIPEFEPVCGFFVKGIPTPKGSMTVGHIVIPEVRKQWHRLDLFKRFSHGYQPVGDPIVSLRPSNANKLRKWILVFGIQADLAARSAHINQLHQGPIMVFGEFLLSRPKNHYGTGRNAGVIKARFSDAQPITRPDLDKLLRAILDVLTGIIYKDDSQVVFNLTKKRYTDSVDELTGCRIMIAETATTSRNEVPDRR